ncbi:mechanosensitive ion channel family protein [Sodalinema gerasimenkoae]|uniref:mechanosensitive ion channel family protein n=1 Tax=Sodalinema gerasimenkoae TaxID=2862348 RepID=UPI00135895EE|nr:mechanosensitive ion channel family protein [Sodalinema gerasimenkoae]
MPVFRVRHLQKLLGFLVVLVLSLTTVLSLASIRPNMAQAQTPLPIPIEPSQEDTTTAPVRLSGLTVLRISSPPTIPGEPRTIPELGKRVTQIERNLNTIIEDGFNPESLQVRYDILNNQPVISAQDNENLLNRQILTVTQFDAEVADTGPEQLAQQWSEQIRESLIRAQQERLPGARRRRWRNALGLAAIMFLLSPILWFLQRQTTRHYHNLSRQRHPEHLQLPQEDMGPEGELNTTRTTPQFLRALLPQIVLERRISMVILLRRVLLFLQLAVWIGGVILILYQFPASRAQAAWLQRFPVQILTIWLFVAVANKLTDVLFDNILQSWVQQESLNPTASKRFILRAPTLAAALKGMTSFIAGLIGVIWFLALQNFPLDSLITGAGIFGVALTIVFQNLIKDLINGILILWEDQFAVGDVIDVGHGPGFVEYMNLRVTRLRGQGGRLSTIPNSQIEVVHNLTKEWSRIDFRIRISQDADALEAIQVMRRTMEQMQADPDWTESIIEPTMLAGVEGVDERGTELLMWTKTKPLQQWAVEREYRRRLKLAFDQAGIKIAIPKQMLWFNESPSDGDEEENNHHSPPQPSSSQPLA